MSFVNPWMPLTLTLEKPVLEFKKESLVGTMSRWEKLLNTQLIVWVNTNLNYINTKAILHTHEDACIIYIKLE